MSTVTLDQVVETAMQLSPAEREMLLEILLRRRIEARRDEMSSAARESIAAYHVGDMKAQTADEVIEELRQALEADE